MTDAQPDNAAADEIGKFNRLAEAWWDTDGPLKTLHAINPLRLDYIRRQADLNGARVLDVGCGAGILSEAMAAEGADVTGIDLAAANIRVATAHAEARQLNIRYQVAAGEQIAAEHPAGFDVVTCLELLEHVPRPEDVVAACAKAVRPGGTVFFSTLNRNLKSFLMAIVGAEYMLNLLPRGTHEYVKLLRPAELARASRAAGLTLSDLTGLHYNPLTDRYSLGGNVDVNYLACATRPEHD